MSARPCRCFNINFMMPKQLDSCILHLNKLCKLVQLMQNIKWSLFDKTVKHKAPFSIPKLGAHSIQRLQLPPYLLSKLAVLNFVQNQQNDSTFS